MQFVLVIFEIESKFAAILSASEFVSNVGIWTQLYRISIYASKLLFTRFWRFGID